MAFVGSLPRVLHYLLSLIVIVLLCFSSLWAQSDAVISLTSTAPRPLITVPVDEGRRTVLKGNTHPYALAQNDLGAAPADLPMQRMLLVLKRSPEQEFALGKLLENQQDKHSASYHQWLTPEQFGGSFGPTDADVQTITAWLESHGFEVAGLSKGRTVIEFSGSAGQVQEAFQTPIRKYLAQGEPHWANASDPSIPTALTPAVAGILSLHNFPARAFHHDLGVFTRSKETGAVKPLKPLFTFPGENCGVQHTTCYAVGPYDFATIYDVLPLWNGSPAIDGTGQTIAIVAETEINTQDFTDFRNFFGLPTGNLQVIHDGPSPGIVSDETESDLDVQWSGAVARGATIDFVISGSTDTTIGVALSAQYIVDKNLAPVMSMSYGLCELATGTSGNQFYNQLWQQASAQGITALISSGDSGAAGCDPHGATPPAPAQFGLAVTGWGDTPYNVSVGGTDFFDLTDQSTYWNSSNTSTTLASAKSYIPEATWNNTCTNAVFGALLGYSQNAETNCNDSQLIDSVSTDGGSGGKSACTTNNGQTVSSCSGGYEKPAWQTGSPGDGKRDIPDVSLFAAAGSPSGSFYIICEADAVTSGTSCQPNDANTNFFGIGGTSASAPAFAGIMALVNQEMTLLGKSGRQGNANYVLYPMATQVPTAFHDVTTGTIRMPCLTGSTSDCQTSTPGDEFGVQTGYDAAGGFDLATGLGSVDANKLVTNWNTVAGSFRATTTTLGLGSLSITHGASDAVNISVTPSSGTGTPTGTVSLIANTGTAAPNGSGTTGVQAFSLSGGSVSTPTNLLPGGGPYAVKAHYAGDGTFAASDSSTVMVTVAPENSTTTLSGQTFVLSGNLLNLVSLGSGTAYGNLIYFEADVAGASRQGSPTGSVTFADATSDPTIPGNPYSLNSAGVATTVQGLYTLPPGSYSVTAKYGSDASFNASNSSPLAFTITKATTGSAVASSANSVSTGGSVTLTATISTGTATVPSFGAAPTGTVSFFANGTLLGSAQPVTGAAGTGSFTGGSFQLASATAALTTSSLASGSNSITATYSGDANYSSSTSAAITVTVQADFTLPSSGLGTVTISAPGGSGTVNLSITPGTGFNSAVTFTCVSTTLPHDAVCGQGTIAAGQTTGTMTVTTMAAQSMLVPGRRKYFAWLTMGGILFGICLLAGAPRQRRTAWMAAMVFAVLLLVPACGGGGNNGGGGTKDPGTPVGTTTVTVNATSGTITHSTSFALTVQ